MYNGHRIYPLPLFGAVRRKDTDKFIYFITYVSFVKCVTAVDIWTEPDRTDTSC